jgi:phosphoribosylanthranilate isomerase
MSKIKICGLFREQDVEFVNEALPDFIGFVFVEDRKRFVDAKKAESLKKNLSKKIISVGVFIQAKIPDIVSLHKNGIIEMIQLHGNESDEYVEELKTKTDAEIIRVGHEKCSYILLDSATPGSGKPFDWSSLKGLDLSKNVFLAGGINLENIEEALKFNPYAVDVSSGAETNGVKDREKIFKLVEICKLHQK